VTRRLAPLAPWLLGLAAATPVSACISGGSELPHTCTLSVPSPPDWRLRADGTLLRDGLGRVVFLRGVDAGGRSKFSPYVPFDYTAAGYDAALAAYMDRAASWGIDAMRVPFTWAALEPVQGQQDTDWLARYQALLDAAWARGIWTVVDFHQDVYSESFCGDGFPSWTIADAPAPHHDCPSWQLEYFSDKAVQAAFDAFWASGSAVQSQYLAAWDSMIARFANEAGVLGFEPINEPAAGTADQNTFEATTLTDFYSRVVPHMRALAPSSLVFVDAPGLDSVGATTAMTRPQGDGLVFAPHYYPISNANPSIVLPGIQQWASVGAAWNVPVFLGEFGFSDQSDLALDFMIAHFAALDALGMSGTEWEYSVASESWNSETDGVVAADGTEYPVAGALVRPFARAVAGDAVTQSWDPATGTFTLSYAPSPSAGTQITEIQLPPRAYPTGYVVQLTSGCYDATSAPGRLLVQPDPGATSIALSVVP
jgi:endoglycosylceramidase